MEAYGLFYSCTQYWTHSSKGYLVHGPCFPRYTCLDIWKCTKFKRLSYYLIRCVHRADSHFKEAHGLYYSYTQYWTHSSKGYLVHGPCFPRYTCLDIRKCTKFKRLSHYLIRCVHRDDFHFMPPWNAISIFMPPWNGNIHLGCCWLVGTPLTWTLFICKKSTVESKAHVTNSTFRYGSEIGCMKNAVITKMEISPLDAMG